MLFKNRELERAFTFIRDTSWDIFCLQEVPEEFLTRLKTLPFQIASAPEVDVEFRKNRATLHTVILSRYSLLASLPIPLPAYSPNSFIIRNIFTRVMFAFGLWTKVLGNRRALSADVQTSEGIVRVFNLHLSLLNPHVRFGEFERAMTEHDRAQASIVCGDFNILERLHITPLNFFLGGKMSDVFLFTRERTRIEERFFEYELLNPLRGRSTHPLSRSQLDHILVSKSFSIKNAGVIKDRRGSDHCPISVEIEALRT